MLQPQVMANNAATAPTDLWAQNTTEIKTFPPFLILQYYSYWYLVEKKKRKASTHLIPRRSVARRGMSLAEVRRSGGRGPRVGVGSGDKATEQRAPCRGNEWRHDHCLPRSMFFCWWADRADEDPGLLTLVFDLPRIDLNSIKVYQCFIISKTILRVKFEFY